MSWQGVSIFGGFWLAGLIGLMGSFILIPQMVEKQATCVFLGVLCIIFMMISSFSVLHYVILMIKLSS